MSDKPPPSQGTLRSKRSYSFDDSLHHRSRRPGGSSHGKRKVPAAPVTATPKATRRQKGSSDSDSNGEENGEDEHVLRLVPACTTSPAPAAGPAAGPFASPFRGLRRLVPSRRRPGNPKTSDNTDVETFPCSHYGPNRNIEFPNFNFCAKCEMWDAAVASGTAGRMKRDSTRNACQAHHTSPLWPTDRLKEPSKWSYFKKNVVSRALPRKRNAQATTFDYADRSDSDDSGDDARVTSSKVARLPSPDTECASAPIVAAAKHSIHGWNAFGGGADSSSQSNVTAAGGNPIINDLKGAPSSLFQTVVFLNSRVTELESENVSLRKDNVKLRHDKQVLEASLDESRKQLQQNPVEDMKLQLLPNSFGAVVGMWVNQQRRENRARVHPLANKIIEEIMSDNALHGMLREANLVTTRKYFQSNVFTPLRILEKMDLAGGQLSYTGIEVMRGVESMGVPYHRGCIPSTSSIKRMAKVVEKLADKVTPIKFFRTTYGEAFRFEIGPLVTAILKAHKLYDAEERPILLSTSMDGAKLCSTKGNLMVGFSPTDLATVDPRTGQVVGVSLDDDSPPESVIQSVNFQFPAAMAIMPETKESVKELAGPLFEWTERASLSSDELHLTGEAVPDNPEMPGLKKFKISARGDLVEHHKALDSGGTCKQTPFFCIYCCKTSDCIHIPNDERCATFCEALHSNNPEFACEI